MAVKKSTAKKNTKVVKNTKTVSNDSFKATSDFQILLKQHVGKPCVPCVKKGDSVDVGTLIAKPQGLGANIHSSVAGKVTKVTDLAIFIKPAKAITSVPEKVAKTIKSNKSDLLNCVNEAGVVGMGGAGFPTGTKLATDLKGGYILVNAAECEPLLAHNMEQIRKYPNETVKGIHYCMKIANASHGIIAIKKKHEKEIEALLGALKGINDIHVHLLPDIYPMGDERAVVRECLGKLIPVTALPSEANAHVCNVESVFRVFQAIEYGRPVVSKNVTVVGNMKWGKDAKVMLEVPIGMKVKDVLDWAGGIDGKFGEIIMGGPFMGKPCSLDDPITKTTGGLIVTKPFTKEFNDKKVGLLVCACGGNEERLRDIAKKYGMKVVGDVQFCKQALDPKGNGMRKCENPGNCPGQAIKCMNIKKAGASEILISNCSDCTNTVMGSAPGLGLNVHHETDHVFETVGMEVMRKLTKSKFVDGAIPEGCTASRNPEDKEHANEGGNKKYPPVSTEPYQFREDTPDGELLISIEAGSDISIKWED